MLTDTVLGGGIVALLVGLLLGLERERSKQPDEGLFAGIRTFPILSLAGYLAAVAAKNEAPLTLPAVLLAVGALGVASYLRSPSAHAGATTEVTALVAPLLGALVIAAGALPAASLAVLVTLLLTLKAPLHKVAGSINEEEILSILKFGVVSVVLVPLLPTDPIGPYGAIVPRHLGVVVVVLSGVSLAGYLLVRTLGGRAGWSLAGLLGGLVSSTAVTLSFAGKARSSEGLVRALAVGIVAASTVLYLRGVVILGLLDATLAGYLAPRLAALFVLGSAFAVAGLRGKGDDGSEPMTLGNPVELSRALGLALLFAAILVVARVAQARLGTTGLWVTGLLGGLVDVDSVAVAAARLRQQGVVPVEGAAGAYLVATLANLVVKGGIVAVVGGRMLARRVLPAFVTLAGATGALLAAGLP